MDNDCYSCVVAGRALDLVVQDLEHGRMHFDFKGRPLYIYTPWRHVTDVSELSGEEWVAFYREMTDFMSRNLYTGYQIMMNFGNWVTHRSRHLHWKIACDEATIYGHKSRHLRRVQNSR